MKKLTVTIFLLWSGIYLLQSQSITFELPIIPYPETDVIVPITITEWSNIQNFTTFQFVIQYNPEVLTPLGVLCPNPSFPFYEWSINVAYALDKIILTWLSFSGGSLNITPPEVLCEIEFSHSDGCSPLEWDTVYISGVNVTTVDGSIGCPTTGIAEQEDDNIRIWSYKKNIFVVSETRSKGEITVFDMLGREVISEPIKTPGQVIQVSGSNSAFYLVEVITTNKRTIQKVPIR